MVDGPNDTMSWERAFVVKANAAIATSASTSYPWPAFMPFLPAHAGRNSHLLSFGQNWDLSGRWSVFTIDARHDRLLPVGCGRPRRSHPGGALLFNSLHLDVVRQARKSISNSLFQLFYRLAQCRVYWSRPKKFGSIWAFDHIGRLKDSDRMPMKVAEFRQLPAP